jgi:hypothetical protein
MTMPQYDALAGVGLPHSTILAAGSRVAAYLRSGGPRTAEVLPVEKIVTNLNAACSMVNAGLGDTIIVLPDHAESFASADSVSNLREGTQIIGQGIGARRPSFTWTAAAASFLFDVANVRLSNSRLFLAGPTASTTALTVAAPITISAPGAVIDNCYINWGVDADQLVTIGITTTAAADDFVFWNNRCIGATAATATTFLRLVGADHAIIGGGTHIEGATSSATVGPIQFITTASTNVKIDGLHVRNNLAASSHAITCLAGCSGHVNNVGMTVLDDAAGNMVLGDAVGAWGASVGSFTFGRNVYVANLAGERMGEVTVVSA